MEHELKMTSDGRRRIALLFRLWAIVVSVGVITGCSDGRPERFPVSGQVLIDGEPLTVGQVMVAPKGAKASVGSVDENGRFTLSCHEIGDGVVPGTHPVAVTAREQLTPTSQRWLAPKRYQDPKTSGIEVTVDGPKDDWIIELQWEGGKPFVEQFK